MAAFAHYQPRFHFLIYFQKIPRTNAVRGKFFKEYYTMFVITQLFQLIYYTARC